MKKAFIILTTVLFATMAQGQTLTQQDLMGTWLVSNVENTNSNPKMASAMADAVINLYADNSFEIKEKQQSGANYTYKTTTHKNATWSYNPSTQTISTTRSKMTLKVSQSGGKTYFTDADSGLKFEVTKPI